MTTEETEERFSERLRRATSGLHIEAERTGFIADLLRNKASLEGYRLYLRSLLPVYQAMEDGLDRHASTPGVRAIAQPQLYRYAALKADIDKLDAEGRTPRLPLPAGVRYAHFVAASANGDACGLIAHAYVRYLGDLSGGQILKRLLNRSLGIEPLSFYDFPGIGDTDTFKNDYRRAFDRAGEELTPHARLTVLEEAKEAFRFNIDLSNAVKSRLSERLQSQE